MSWHRVQHTAITAYSKDSGHPVQHTQSTVYNEYNIHRLLYPPKSVCFPFILMIIRWLLNVGLPSTLSPNIMDHHQPALPDSSMAKVTNCWIDSHHLALRVSTDFKYLSNHVRSQPLRVSVNSLDHAVHVRIITSSKWIAKFSLLQDSSSHYNVFPVDIPKFTR
jgi:hypothetical protein